VFLKRLQDCKVYMVLISSWKTCRHVSFDVHWCFLLNGEVILNAAIHNWIAMIKRGVYM